MNETTTEGINGGEFLGIFELDDSGRVIHLNLEGSIGWPSFEKDIKGRDFFDEVLGFTNVADLRRRLETFKAQRLPAYSFDFVCRFHEQAVPVRVLLAQRCDVAAGEPRSLLVHLRRTSPKSTAKAAGDRF